MPIPQPRANEERSSFISRCMGDDVMNSDYPDQKQRAGVCYTQWRESKKALDPLDDGLIQSMAEELKAAEVYKERARPLANINEMVLAVYAHVIQEEYEHFEEFLKALEGDTPVSSAELEVRFVSSDVLLDYKGVNPAFAKLIGFKGCADNEILILQGMSDAETQLTIDHERQENDMLNSSMTYWEAHTILMKREEETMKYKDAKRLMAVKFADEEKGIIEGIYAPFGGPLGGKDLQGEYFDKDTDFCEKWFGSRPILYHHGMDDSIKAQVIGHDIATKVLDNGRWLQAQLDKSVAYWKELKQLILDGRMFFSSGAVPHLVEKAVDGRLIRWPWVETSLTVSPANPLATVDSMKAIDFLKAIGATEEQLKVLATPIEASIESLKEGKDMKEAAKAKKTIKVTCPKCSAEFDYEIKDMPEPAGTPAADPNAQATEHAPAGDKNPPATNPGVNQGLAPETHVEAESTETAGQSGQHGGATAAPDKPEGDKTPNAGKGETPKPAADRVEKEPEPPHATTQASDNTITSTAVPSSKAVDGKLTQEQIDDIQRRFDERYSKGKVEVDATKAAIEISKATDGIKAMMAEHLKAVEGSVKEAVKPLEERIKALESQPAKDGPIRRAPNPANPLESRSPSELQRIFDDPKTPAAIKAYIGEQLAAAEVSAMIQQGPQRLGRKSAEQ